MKGNEEQVLAIAQRGNLLLEAGAGSGKTFVLIEHLIFILTQKKELLQNEKSEARDWAVKKIISSIVLMTFTNKAADEMVNRARDRVREEEKICSSDDLWFWNAVEKNINDLVITTIHGFCYRLVKEGMILDIDPDVMIISDRQFRTKLEGILQIWVEENVSKQSIRFIKHCLWRNKKEFLSILETIFSDPILREKWKEEKPKIDFEKNILKLIIEKYYSTLFEFPIDLTNYAENKTKIWWQKLSYVENFFAKKQLAFELNSLIALFEEIKGIRIPGEIKSIESFNFFWQKLLELKKFIQNNQENLVDGKDYESLNQLIVFLREMITFIEKKYHFFSGITYADLEYYVWRNLKNDLILQKISDRYHYFIVDEFQDTSRVQYEIIQKLILNDWSRLYSVGDPKQAIYAFRGGDLSIYKECQERVEHALKLKNNYRSKPEIVFFNNQFFAYLFENPIEEIGSAHNQVPFLKQEVPKDINVNNDEKGKIVLIQKTILSNEKFSSEKINQAEAKAFVDWYSEKSLDFKNQDVLAVLYKNLRPIRHLIFLLMEKEISFTAQIRIPGRENFIWGTFFFLLEGIFLPHLEALKVISFFIGNYLYQSGLEIQNIEEEIEVFFRTWKDIGFYQSYIQFLFNLKLIVPTAAEDLSFIKNIIDLSYDNPEIMYKNLLEMQDVHFSIEVQFGEHSKKIKIMTVHGAKGLEFDHVAVLGLYSNGRERQTSRYIGNSPNSVVWDDPLEQKKIKSPKFLLDELNYTEEEENESIRLFYVACTRGKRNLIFVKNSWNLQHFKCPSGSWYYALNTFLEKQQFHPQEIFMTEDISLHKSERDYSDRAFFHFFPLGPILTENPESQSLAVLSDLSVTMLATLSECPKKFYFQNVCELDDDSFDEYRPTSLNLEKINKDKQESSSAERGLKVHQQLSRFIKTKNEFHFDRAFLPIIGWLKNLLQGEPQLISEKTIKFSFFGFMLTGTPDLVLMGEKKQIWDFKTGSRKENLEDAYWFQLKAYAFGYYTLGHFVKEDSVTLSLLYVDEKVQVTKTLNYKYLEEELWQVWNRQKNLNQFNRAYCETCLYQRICPNST